MEEESPLGRPRPVGRATEGPGHHGWGWGDGNSSSGGAASPFQAKDTAIPNRLLKHGQHVDLIHHHVQLMPGRMGGSRWQGGESLVYRPEAPSPGGWGGSESEIQRSQVQPGLPNLFYPGTIWTFDYIFQTHRKPHTQSR